MATVTTIRPETNGTLRNDGFQTTTASTSTTTSTNAALITASNDNSNDTFIQKPNTGGAPVWWASVANPGSTLPASGDFVASVVLRCKMSQASTGYVTTALYTTNNATAGTLAVSGSVGSSHGRTVSFYQRTGTTAKLTTAATHGLAVNDSIVVQGVLAALNGAYTVTGVPTSTTVEYTTATSATVAQTATGAGAVVSQVVNKDLTAHICPSTTDGLWTSTRINDITVQFIDSSTSTSLNGRPRIYGLDVIVTTSTLPAFGAAPSVSGAGSSSRPTVNLGAYSQGDSYAQNGVQVRVFSAAKTDPTVSTDLVWDSGTLGNVSTIQIGTDLNNGSTYYVYARTAADASGNGAQRAWSAWGSGTATSTVSFTLSLTAPTAPSWTTASWNGTTQAVSLTALGAAFASGTQVFEMQRSNDNGTTWYQVRGASALTPSGSYVASVTDYEAMRGTTSTVKYRVRAVGTVGSNTVNSAWTTTTLANTTVTNGGGWTLRSFSSTARTNEILGARVLEGPEIQREESVGVFRPLGRTSPVVVHGDLEGNDGSWQIVAQGATEWTNLRSVINSQQLILVMDPFGGHRYVRVTNRNWTQRGTYDNPRYEVQVSYVEVQGDIAGQTADGGAANGGTGYFSRNVDEPVSI